MEIATIGILTLSPDALFWTLRYPRCGHTQQFTGDHARPGLEQAEREVRRYYATCLTCQLEMRSRRVAGTPAFVPI